MHSCHSHGILHRDVKPQNFLFDISTSTGTLIDFDCAFAIDRKLPRSNSGTPGYKAPEVLEDTPYSTPADIWSGGVTIAEAILEQSVDHLLEEHDEVDPNPKLVREVLLTALRRCVSCVASSFIVLHSSCPSFCAGFSSSSFPLSSTNSYFEPFVDDADVSRTVCFSCMCYL